MFRPIFIRGLILILVLALGVPLASAAGSREREELSIHSALSALWKTFTGFLSDAGLDVVLADGTTSDGGGSGAPGDPNSGPGMDPNGGPPKGP